EPAPVPQCPHVGIAARTRLAVGLPVRSASVNDCEIAHHPDQHVFALEVRYRYRFCDLREELRTIYQGAVGVGIEEIVRQQFSKPSYVGSRYRTDVILVKLAERF